MPPVRQRRLDAGVPDGREVRPRPRRRSTVRSSRSTTLVKPAPGAVTDAAGAAGYPASAISTNDAFIAVNRLLKAGEEVLSASRDRSWQSADGTGVMFVAGQGRRRAAMLQKAAAELGLTFDGVATRVRPATLHKLQPPRIGLWDRYGGSMPSGWTRWLLEQYEFRFEVVYPADARRRQSARRSSTCCIFPDGGDSGAAGWRRRRRIRRRPPAERRRHPGRVSRHGWAASPPSKTVPQLKQFLEDGGTIVAIGGSTTLGEHLGLPVERPPGRDDADGDERALPRDKFYVPGSILQRGRRQHQPARRTACRARGRRDVRQQPGVPSRPDAALEAASGRSRGSPAATPLRSGWAWGQTTSKAAWPRSTATVGKGKVTCSAPRSRSARSRTARSSSCSLD